MEYNTRRVGQSLLALVLLAATFGRPVAAQLPSTPAPNGPPHIFYGSVPQSPPYSVKPLVLVFIHGLHGKASDWWINNDMYAQAYDSGYRTAFVSMNLDNTPNDANIEDNAEVVKAALPLIAQQYSTDKVVLVGHSKGGLDIQAALLDPAIRALVRAVFTISTPNTGTELADWAFGPGQPIAGQLGLLTPGVEALKLANMAAFRTSVDPTLRASGIPFYTIGGTDARGNVVTALTGLILFDLTKQENDGLVPFARTKLSPDFSNDLGEIKANHFAIDSGSSALAKISARLQALEFTLNEFERIASAGFGDSHNNWMWSSEWFKNKLYVGTGREIQCFSVLSADKQVGTNIYPLSVLSGDCPIGPVLVRALAAEIWSYDPATKEWLRVFKSPEDVFLGNVGPNGEAVFTAHDIGFRGMTTFIEADGTEALYVGSVTSAGVYEDQSGVGSNGYPPPRLLRSVDGSTFEPVPQTPGTFLGEIGKSLPGSTRLQRTFRSLTPYKGMLFATVGDFRGLGAVIASADPSAGDDAWFQASPIPEDFPVWNLMVFNDFLYATTGDKDYNDIGFGLFKTDASGTPPYAWTPIITEGAYQTNTQVRSPNGLSFAEFNGQLYLGTNRPTELYRINPDDTWDLIVGEARDTPQGLKAPLSGMGIGFGNWFNGHFWRMASHGGQLYVTTWDASVGLRFLQTYDKIFGFQYGFDLYRTRDGIYWESVTRSGFLDGLDSGGRTIKSTPAGLFVGTARPTEGAQIYLCEPPKCTDLEPPPALPAPQQLQAESEELSGRQVLLSWQPVPGAVRYRIYRATVMSVGDFLPQDTKIEALTELPTPAVGLPTPFVQAGISLTTEFTEASLTPYQSLYFVRAEDEAGNLSTSSNIVGGPSKAAPPPPATSAR